MTVSYKLIAAKPYEKRGSFMGIGICLHETTSPEEIAARQRRDVSGALAWFRKKGIEATLTELSDRTDLPECSVRWRLEELGELGEIVVSQPDATTILKRLRQHGPQTSCSLAMTFVTSRGRMEAILRGLGDKVCKIAKPRAMWAIRV